MICQRLLLILLCWQWLAAGAQSWQPAQFKQYTTADGLSHNTVSALAQDSAGYIWMTTQFGLNRFDGSRFVQFHSSSDSNSLGADELWVGMTWLDKRRLAVPGGGLHIIDTRTGRHRNVFISYHRKQYQFKFNLIERTMGDKNGDVYILSRSGFYHYDSAYKLVSRFDFYSEAEVPVTHFFFGRGLFVLDEARLMISSIDGLYVYDKRTKKVRKMAAGDCPLLAEFLSYPEPDFQFFQHQPGTFIVFKSDNDTALYINLKQNKKVISKLPFAKARSEFGWRTRLLAASDSVLYFTGHISGFFKMRLNSQSGKLNMLPEKYFPAYLCNALLKDRDGHLWVATNKGVFRQNPQFANVQAAHLPNGIEDRFPYIRIDDVWSSSNTIYAGARSEGGLFLFDKKTLELKDHLVFTPNDGRNTIRAIAPVDSQRLLLGTHGPLLLFHTGTKKASAHSPKEWDNGIWTADLFKDRRGRIWVASYYNYMYTPEKKTFRLIPTLPELLSVPFALTEDQDGNIWMSGHGVARYNVRQGKYDLLLDSFPYIKMPDKQVPAIAIDKQNRVWFHSGYNGLTGYDIKRKKYLHFTRSHGLPDDNITSLIVVDNHLWIACYSGIACMDLQSFSITSFSAEDGFPPLPIVKGTHFYYDSIDKHLYIGMSTAVVRFRPSALLQERKPPQIFLESVVINSTENLFLPGDKITISWKNNEMRFTIGSINFTDPAQQRFAYRIADDDATPWTDIGRQPSFAISRLSTGTHRIQIKSVSANRHWPPQVKEFTIVVLPPVWRETWFLILLGALVLALIYLFIRWRINIVRRKEMVKTQIEKLKADDYKNQFELEQITNYFSSSLADKKTEEEVLWDVSRNLIGRLNYEDCIIYLWNCDKTKMVQKAGWGPKGEPEMISTHVFEVLPGQGIVGHVVATKQPLLVNDTRKDKRYRVDDDFRLSELTVPIIHNDELLGVIDSEHHQLNYFNERDLKILTTIATLLGNKLKQLESERSLEAKQKELVNINEQLAEARLSALQAQMNPHFVFNALNSIKRMILDSDNEKASRYLSKFALMIRMTLDHSKEIFVTLGNNIAYLKSYLEMEQLRFDDSFNFCICVDDDLDTAETLIPAMMIQPLVENAIWHGLMQSENEKKISISFRSIGNEVVCTVEDNGIGIHRSEELKKQQRPFHRSVGLENLQNRIRIMNDKYDLHCQLRIADLQNEGRQGTKAVLRFHYITT